ncbi:uncharacterized protein [Aquarana catesbeiana]|uniref:uncharacterized protein isoform X2 n=1 Tax=Aquarana catesbeiana TaxID=8400 RepID=UPI003CCA6B26
MMIFYFWVLVVSVIGLSDGESVMCLRGRSRKDSVTCSDDHQSPTEGYEKEIHLWCDNKEIICSVSPNNVNSDMKPQEVKCKTQKSGEEKVETYYCQIEKPLYISALLSALPGEAGSQDWKNKVAYILEGVPGVQEWLNKSEEFWEELPEPQDWLSRIKQFFTGKETSDPSDDDDEDDDEQNEKKDDDGNDENNRFQILKIVLPCVAVVLIVVICAFLWGKNRNRQRNLEIGGASDRPGRKMGSTGDINLKSNEFPPLPHRPSHIYQEIPATQEDPAKVLQNPLYTPSGPPSLEQQSGSQGEHPAEGQYSLLQPPTQLQPPDQQ